MSSLQLKWKGHSLHFCKWYKESDSSAVSIITEEYLPIPDSEIIDKFTEGKDNFLVIRQKISSPEEFVKMGITESLSSTQESKIQVAKEISDTNRSLKWKDFTLKYCRWYEESKTTAISIVTSGYLPMGTGTEIIDKFKEGGDDFFVIRLKVKTPEELRKYGVMEVLS